MTTTAALTSGFVNRLLITGIQGRGSAYALWNMVVRLYFHTNYNFLSLKHSFLCLGKWMRLVHHPHHMVCIMAYPAYTKETRF